MIMQRYYVNSCGHEIVQVLESPYAPPTSQKPDLWPLGRHFLAPQPQTTKAPEKIDLNDTEFQN